MESHGHPGLDEDSQEQRAQGLQRSKSATERMVDAHVLLPKSLGETAAAGSGKAFPAPFLDATGMLVLHGMKYRKLRSSRSGSGL